MFLALYWCENCDQLRAFQPSQVPSAGATCADCSGELLAVTATALVDGRVAFQVDEYSAGSELARYLINGPDPRPRPRPGALLFWYRGPEGLRTSLEFGCAYFTWDEALQMVRRGWDVATSDPTKVVLSVPSPSA